MVLRRRPEGDRSILKRLDYMHADQDTVWGVAAQAQASRETEAGQVAFRNTVRA